MSGMHFKTPVKFVLQTHYLQVWHILWCTLIFVMGDFIFFHQMCSDLGLVYVRNNVFLFILFRTAKCSTWKWKLIKVCEFKVMNLFCRSCYTTYCLQGCSQGWTGSSYLNPFTPDWNNSIFIGHFAQTCSGNPTPPDKLKWFNFYCTFWLTNEMAKDGVQEGKLSNLLRWQHCKLKCSPPGGSLWVQWIPWWH